MTKVRWDRSKGRPEPVAALNRIRERDNGEPLVLLQDVAPSVRLARDTVIPYLRLGAAEKLELAARSLPEGFLLGVIDAWRPFARQKRIYDWMTANATEAFPHLPRPALRRMVNRWAAPIDQKAPPGHCTGGAVDVWLLHANGEQADVVSPYERFSGAPTYVFGLTLEAQRNRTILVDAMLGAGFSNCRDEWWHYSVGDAGWAVRMGIDTCYYGLVELDPSLYAEQERLWEIMIAKRSNPFLTGK